MRITLALTTAAAVVLVPMIGRAEPVIGTAVELGEPVESGDSSRVGVSLSVQRAVGSSTYGLEVSGAYGGYMGGWACDTQLPPDAVVPAVAVWCQRPGVSTHALAGHEMRWGLRTRGRLEIGAGAAGVWTPLAGGESRFSLHPSGLIRALVLFRVGEWGGGDWWTGLRAQEHIFGIAQPAMTASIGWVLEAAVIH